MSENYSKSIRNENNEKAFDAEEWEFKSHQFISSAKFLAQSFDDRVDTLDFDSIMFLPTAEFLLSFSIELICKAYYLAKGDGPREAIYGHDVVSLFQSSELTAEQAKLLEHTARYVIWAGKYPTPKWTKEKFKKDSDVPSEIVNGIERINALDMPGTSSRPRVDEMFELYNFIHDLWSKAKGVPSNA
jgi:hypothetical protein